MSKFGWSYPPGVSKLPWEDDPQTCEICLGNPDDGSCLCPECRTCGEAGNPACYDVEKGHGLTVNPEFLPVIKARRQTLQREQEQELLADAALAEHERQMAQELPWPETAERKQRLDHSPKPEHIHKETHEQQATPQPETRRADQPEPGKPRTRSLHPPATDARTRRRTLGPNPQGGASHKSVP